MGATNIQARYGSTGTGIWGPIETVNDAGADVPVAAIGNDGTGVAAWERATMSGNTVRRACARRARAGIWSDIHILNAQHANYTKPLDLHRLARRLPRSSPRPTRHARARARLGLRRLAADRHDAVGRRAPCSPAIRSSWA